MLDWFWSTLTVIGFLTVFTYLGPILLAAFVWKEQNLKAKYNAKWALITGSSSGIGKSLAEKLAKQGLNVVLVAIDDDLLKTTHRELTERFPSQEFRAIGVNLGKRTDSYDYMNVIKKGTEDIEIQLVFNNAGYLILKGFIRATEDAQMANWECNVTSALRITHHFLSKMEQKKLKGCIAFTSSTAGYFPAPASCVYGSSKAALATFASCLACEVKKYGIDVLCLNSGPMRTRFYETLPKLDLLNFFHLISDTPDTVADVMLKGIGRMTWRDSSLYAVVNRLVIKIVDMNLLVDAIAWGQQFISDYKKHPELS